MLFSVSNVFVFHESPLRICDTMKEIKKFALNNSRYFICRELTKIYETFYQGILKDCNIDDLPKQGEYTVVISPNENYTNNLSHFLVENTLTSLIDNNIDKKRRVKYCCDKFNMIRRDVDEIDDLILNNKK